MEAEVRGGWCVCEKAGKAKALLRYGAASVCPSMCSFLSEDREESSTWALPPRDWYTFVVALFNIVI